MDEGHPISFRVLERGTAVWTSDDQEVGTVDGVLATDREDIFDGIVIRTATAGGSSTRPRSPGSPSGA